MSVSLMCLMDKMTLRSISSVPATFYLPRFGNISGLKKMNCRFFYLFVGLFVSYTISFFIINQLCLCHISVSVTAASLKESANADQ